MTPAQDKDRRRALRMPLVLPMQVKGFLGGGASWEDASTTRDVSHGGASFPLQRSLELGQVLVLTLPLPRRLRDYDLRDPSYKVYSLVRHLDRREDVPVVGVMFFGKFPPKGFDERPNARFFLPSDQIPDLALGDSGQGVRVPSPAMPTTATATAPTPDSSPHAWVGGERRRWRRHEVRINFLVQQMDEWGVVLQEELTHATSLSPGGARLVTTLSLHKGDVILLHEAAGGFTTRAEVREVVKSGQATAELHLRFVDREAPSELIRD